MVLRNDAPNLLIISMLLASPLLSLIVLVRVQGRTYYIAQISIVFLQIAIEALLNDWADAFFHLA